MVMHANGAGGATELGYETPYAAMEQEDELQELEAWEQPEAHPYAAPYAAPEWAGEEEAWEAPGYEGLPESYEAAYAAPSAAGEWAGEEEAWELPEAQETDETDEAPEMRPYAGQEFAGEGEAWETPETYEGYETYETAAYASHEDEADQFLPLLAPLAMKALPLMAKFALPAAKKLLPFAKQAVSGVVRNVLSGAGGARPAGRAGGPRAARAAQLDALFRQLRSLLREGESEAAALEAQLFGANEFEGELAAHEAAHEAALTEVLAAEASHTASEGEAAAILGATLPITITIMGGRRALRPVLPTLTRANGRLVRGLYRSGPAGPQLVRLAPAIQRRTVGSLLAAQRAGRPITPGLATRVMAGQAARVLATPRLGGPALVRNTAIRQATVAPAGRMVRPAPRPYRG